jgi:cell division protein FtsX
METIIVKPKNAEEAKEVLAFLKQRKIKKEVHKERTKEEILDSIERGAKEVAEYLQGKRKLRSAKEFLNELRG